MSRTIHKDDSAEAIQRTIRKMVEKKKKKPIDLDRYFGKVDFGMDGLDYQKSIRNEWK
ncbi:MAG: hypothetical protein RI575_18390 [Balneolaceae bacterium]|nr:hypothetical protein [Balneolaceae bacterium]